MKKDRLSSIYLLALPIIGGMVSQNVLNLVDTWMVGALDNPNPGLAATNLGGFATFMSQALLLGISSGVQATAARRKGEGKVERMAVSLNAGLILVLMVAPVFSAILYFLVPMFYPFLNADPEVIRVGVPYLQVRILAIACVAINFAFRGYWNAINLSKLYMSTLIVMHISNIFLNWVFIFGNLGAPELGVMGAGVASALSTLVANGTYFYLGWKHARPHGFLKIRPAASEFSTLVRLSLPNGIQQLFFAAGLTALFTILGKVSTEATAAAGVLINITLVAILPGLGLGLAAATLVGQALGRGDKEDAKAWGWDVVKVALVVLGVLGLPMWLMPELVLSPFLKDPETLKLAKLPLIIVGLFIAIEGIGLVLMNALLGAGASKTVMIVSVMSQWVFFLPIAYVLGPIMGYGLLVIWGLQSTYRAGMSGIFAYIWSKGKWQEIKV